MIHLINAAGVIAATRDSLKSSSTEAMPTPLNAGCMLPLSISGFINLGIVCTPCTVKAQLYAQINVLPVVAHVPAITGCHRECGWVVRVVSFLSIKTSSLSFSRFIHFSFDPLYPGT